MKKCFLSSFITGLILFSSCTYTITMVHTEGSATDVVDDTATNNPVISTSIPTPGI